MYGNRGGHGWLHVSVAGTPFYTSIRKWMSWHESEFIVINITRCSAAARRANANVKYSETVFSGENQKRFCKHCISSKQIIQIYS